VKNRKQAIAIGLSQARREDGPRAAKSTAFWNASTFMSHVPMPKPEPYPSPYQAPSSPGPASPVPRPDPAPGPAPYRAPDPPKE
jgi:hypothetical protein